MEFFEEDELDIEEGRELRQMICFGCGKEIEYVVDVDIPIITFYCYDEERNCWDANCVKNMKKRRDKEPYFSQD